MTINVHPDLNYIGDPLSVVEQIDNTIVNSQAWNENYTSAIQSLSDSYTVLGNISSVNSTLNDNYTSVIGDVTQLTNIVLQSSSSNLPIGLYLSAGSFSNDWSSGENLQLQYANAATLLNKTIVFVSSDNTLVPIYINSTDGHLDMWGTSTVDIPLEFRNASISDWYIQPSGKIYASGTLADYISQNTFNVGSMQFSLPNIEDPTLSDCLFDIESHSFDSNVFINLSGEIPLTQNALPTSLYTSPSVIPPMARVIGIGYNEPNTLSNIDQRLTSLSVLLGHYQNILKQMLPSSSYKIYDNNDGNNSSIDFWVPQGTFSFNFKIFGGCGGGGGDAVITSSNNSSSWWSNYLRLIGGSGGSGGYLDCDIAVKPYQKVRVVLGSSGNAGKTSYIDWNSGHYTGVTGTDGIAGGDTIVYIWDGTTVDPPVNNWIIKASGGGAGTAGSGRIDSPQTSEWSTYYANSGYGKGGVAGQCSINSTYSSIITENLTLNGHAGYSGNQVVSLGVELFNGSTFGVRSETPTVSTIVNTLDHGSIQRNGGHGGGWNQTNGLVSPFYQGVIDPPQPGDAGYTIITCSGWNNGDKGIHL